MMKRYFLLLDPETLEVYLGQPLAEAPDNAVLFVVGENYDFKKPVFDQFPNPTAIVEGVTNDEMRLANIERTKEKYEMHKVNGWNAYQDFRANIVEQIAEEILTKEQAIAIELNLSVGYDKIPQTGDWQTALYLLQNLEVNVLFIEPYRIAAIEIIEAYIANNYES